MAGQQQHVCKATAALRTAGEPRPARDVRDAEDGVGSSISRCPNIRFLSCASLTANSGPSKCPGSTQIKLGRSIKAEGVISPAHAGLCLCLCYRRRRRRRRCRRRRCHRHRAAVRIPILWTASPPALRRRMYHSYPSSGKSGSAPASVPGSAAPVRLSKIVVQSHWLPSLQTQSSPLHPRCCVPPPRYCYPHCCYCSPRSRGLRWPKASSQGAAACSRGACGLSGVWRCL